MSTTPKDDGGAAFPTRERSIGGGYSGASDGMTLRDYFAGQAMIGFATECGLPLLKDEAGSMATAAYELADALLSARQPCPSSGRSGGEIMITAEIETKVHIRLDIETAAKWFANISDDDVSKFFVAVAEEIKQWPQYTPGRASNWFHHIGHHLRTCGCSTEDARTMVREIADAMDFDPPAAAGDRTTGEAG